MIPKHIIPLFTAAAIAGLSAVSGFAQCGDLNPTEQSTKEVQPGVVLTWDSSFHCMNAPDTGTYSFAVTVRNDATSLEAVMISDVILHEKTPRPGGKIPAGSVTAVGGLPTVVAPGQSITFRVEGDYALVTTDEGNKASHHLWALGSGAATGDPIILGFNVHLRAPGVIE